MSVQEIKKMFKCKNSDTAIFLGAGRSINNITLEQWEKIKQCDIWTVNNWVYHPFIVPDFYQIETKYYGYEILQRRLKEKSHLYKDVNFILQDKKAIKVNGISRSLLDVIPFDGNKFTFKMQKRDAKRTHTPFNANYEMEKDVLTKSYDMSVTTVFELLYKFGYKTIITFGIDLGNSYYFWYGGDKKYGEVHHQSNKEHEGKKPTDPHATYKIKDFLIDFNKRFMLPEKRNLFIGHEDTLLFPELKVKRL